MSVTHQRWCAWSIVPFMVVYIVAFAGLAGFVPPHSPLLSGNELLAIYDANRTGIRAGQLIGIVSATLMLLWAAPISVQMARIEKGPFPMFAVMQYGAAVVLLVFFMVCGLLWSIAAYREDIDPASLRMLNDAGWLVFVMAYPEYLVQLGSIALVGFMDKRPQPFLPRGACFFTLWVALAGTGGGFATFFKGGPFAWNGLFGFWTPVALFLIWLFVMLYFLLKAIARQEAEEAIDASPR